MDSRPVACKVLLGEAYRFTLDLKTVAKKSEM